MIRPHHTAIRALVALAVLGLIAPCVRAAEEDEERGWSDKAELGVVATSGNTESTTFGFKNKLWWVGERSKFETNAAGIRTRSIVNKFAVGDPNGNFRVEEENDVTAENYYLDARYDHKISMKFFWFAGASWDRNEFAGIDSRTTGFGGVGNIWLNRKDHKFRTDYAATYTWQKNVVDDDDFDETFGGLRFSWAYLKKLNASTTYTNDLIINMNLEESEDWRGDMINAVAVSMSENLALKVSYQVLYDNLPSFEEIDIFDVSPPGGTNLGTVLVELDEFDTILTASLVVNF